MARNSTERMVASAIWSRDDPLFSPHHRHRVNPPFNIYNCSIMLNLKGGVSIDLLYCCTAAYYLTVFSLVNCAFVYKYCLERLVPHLAYASGVLSRLDIDS